MRNEELADLRADLYRKYRDIYDVHYSNHSAKPRVKEMLGKLEDNWGKESWSKPKSKKLDLEGRERVKELIKTIEGGI